MAYNTNNVSSGATWDNGYLSADQVAELQKAVGAEADGYYGEQTAAAVAAKNGGKAMSQQQAYQTYVRANDPAAVAEDKAWNEKATPTATATPTTATNTTKTTVTKSESPYGTMLNDELAAYKADFKNTYDSTGTAYDNALANKQTAIQTATDSAVNQLRSEWENSIAQYDQTRDKAAYSKAQATDNLAMQNQANGDKGGIAAKLMSDQTAAYDNQIMQIDLEQINLQNQVEQQVAQLIAEGKISEAEAAYEIGIAKMEALNNLKSNYYSTTMNVADTLDNRRLNEYQIQQEQEQNELNKFYQMLDLGIFDATAAEALGIPADQAQAFADYVNQANQLNLEEGKLAIAQAKKNLSATNSGTGSGSGSGTGDGGTYDPYASIPDSVYKTLYESGNRTPEDIYAYLVSNGYSDTEATNIAAYYDDWYSRYSGQLDAIDTAEGSMFSYDIKTGAITWRGEQYANDADFLNAFNAAVESGQITQSQYDATIQAMRDNGFAVGFNGDPYGNGGR